jgi:hypothetical protein
MLGVIKVGPNDSKRAQALSHSDLLRWPMPAFIAASRLRDPHRPDVIIFSTPRSSFSEVGR